MTLFIGQALCHAVAHGSHQTVRGSKVNAHGYAALVGVGGKARLGDVKQCHAEKMLFDGEKGTDPGRVIRAKSGRL